MAGLTAPAGYAHVYYLTAPAARGAVARCAAALPGDAPARLTVWDLPPAAPPPARDRKAHTAPKARTARRNPRPGTQFQSVESGQSQETPTDKTDINTYIGTRQRPDSEGRYFRIICLTCLYSYCRAIVRDRRNLLTNIVLAAEKVVVHPRRMRDIRPDPQRLPPFASLLLIQLVRPSHRDLSRRRSPLG
jgi:hypothetical protein